MSKEWKCVECVKHGTDACYNGSRYEHDDCKYKLIDVDYAYEQGRTDAIDEVKHTLISNIENLPKNPNGHSRVYDESMIIDIIEGVFEQIKEQK